MPLPSNGDEVVLFKGCATIICLALAGLVVLTVAAGIGIGKLL